MRREMNRLFTDLDNTLIYSHRYDITADFRLIEVLNGKNQGYMSNFTYAYLKQAKWLETIPVTTRTQKQYERLEILLCDMGCSTALVGNGAILLQGGICNEKWYRESLELCKNALPQIEKASTIFSCFTEHEKIRGEKPFFVYISGEDLLQIADKLKGELDLDMVDIEIDRKKLFVLPKVLTKGKAIERFHKTFGKKRMLAAGDSKFDCSMLELGDYSFLPQKMAPLVANPNKIQIINEPIISDEICLRIEAMHKKGILDD